MKLKKDTLVKILVTFIPVFVTIIAGFLIFPFIIIEEQKKVDENFLKTTMEKAVKIEPKLKESSEKLKEKPTLKDWYYQTQINNFRSSFHVKFGINVFEKCVNWNITSSLFSLQNHNNCSKGYSEDDIANLTKEFDERKTICENQLRYMGNILESIKNAWLSLPILKERANETFAKNILERYWQRIQIFNKDLIIPVNEVLIKAIPTIPKNQIEVSQRIHTWKLSIGVNYAIILIISIVFSVSEICYLIIVIKQGNDKHSLLLLNLMTLSALCCLIMFVIQIVFGVLHFAEVFPGGYECDSIAMPNLSKITFETFYGKYLSNVHTKCKSPNKLLKSFQVYINSTKMEANYDAYRKDVTKSIDSLMKINTDINLQELKIKMEAFTATKFRLLYLYWDSNCFKSNEDKNEVGELWSSFFEQNQEFEHILNLNDLNIMKTEMREVVDDSFEEYSDYIKKNIYSINETLKNADIDCEYLQIPDYRKLNSQICDRFSNYKTFIGPFSIILMIICCVSVFVTHVINRKILENERKKRQIKIDEEKKKVELEKKNEEK